MSSIQEEIEALARELRKIGDGQKSHASRDRIDGVALKLYAIAGRILALLPTNVVVCGECASILGIEEPSEFGPVIITEADRAMLHSEEPLREAIGTMVANLYLYRDSPGAARSGYVTAAIEVGETALSRAPAKPAEPTQNTGHYPPIEPAKPAEEMKPGE